MKKTVMRIATVVLSAVCLVGAYAGGSGEKKTEPPGGYGKAGTFPLAKQLVIKGGAGASAGGVVTDPNTMLPYLKQLEKETNVKIEWTIYENQDKVNIIFAAGDYPEFAFSTGLWSSLITSSAASGVVPDILQYLGKGYTPNLDAVFAKYPDSLAYCKSPDGKLYSLPQLLRVEANYLEQNFMINKTWLDKLGLKVPTTTEELKQVLIAFRDRDPNGNGKKDEIPFGFVAKDGFAQHLRALYGIWGIPTKDGPIVRNGKVDYSATQPEFKEFIKYMNDLYNEKLIDVESFTQSVSQFDAKVDNAGGALYGFIIAQRGYTGTPGRNQFVSMEPPKAPGHEPSMWVHPGYIAIKNFYFMTKKNKNPEYTMAWFDYVAQFDRSMQAMYGVLGEGVVAKDGKWTKNPDKPVAWFQQNAWGEGWAGRLLDADILDKRWIPSAAEAYLADNYNRYYKQYKAKESWNRPEFTAEENKEVNTLRADLDALWKNKEAEWIVSGKIDAEWDAFLQQMKTMKLDRYNALC